jgi:RNA polymerase sigma-B factor
MRANYGRSPNGGVERNKPGVIAGTSDSLEQPINNDGLGEISLGDILSIGDGGAEDYEFVQLKHTILDVVRTFDRRSQEVFIRRHQLDQTQKEIGQAVGCSQMQVSRLLTKLHRAIREEIAA